MNYMKYKTYKVFAYSDMPENIKQATDWLIGGHFFKYFFNIVCDRRDDVVPVKQLDLLIEYCIVSGASKGEEVAVLYDKLNR